MHALEFGTVGQLSYGLTQKLVYAHPDEIDLVTSADTQLHDVLATAESCAYDDFDLKKVWLTPVRWGSLVRQYIDPTALASWLDLVEAKLTGRKRGISFMRTEVVRERQSEGKISNRRWGSCMLGVGYRAMPRPQITLHSRTSYLGYIGQLDLALACVLAREVGQRVGLEPSKISFAWHLEVAQFHGFKSLAWFYQDDYDRGKIEALSERPPTHKIFKKYPTLRLAANQLRQLKRHDREGTLYGDMSFSQQLRIRRRYHAEVMGPGYGEQFRGGSKLSMTTPAAVLRSVPLSSLDLSPLDPGYSDPDTQKAGIIDDEED